MCVCVSVFLQAHRTDTNCFTVSVTQCPVSVLALYSISVTFVAFPLSKLQLILHHGVTSIITIASSRADTVLKQTCLKTQ